jgi:hypothetical protein
LRDR